MRPVLPVPLAALGDLATNLRWSWHPETQDVFRAVDADAWESTAHDPVKLLGAVSPARLAELAEDKRFLRMLELAAADLDHYLAGDRWFQRSAGPEAPTSIGYFSPEFGITSVLPQYSGGLGILAGDHLKTASDLGIPIVGVGLLYKMGYFRQSLSREGWQQETYPVLDPDGLPIALLREADGSAAKVTIELPGDAPLVARIFVAHVGRVPLLLLDSDVEENPEALREVTDRLYGGSEEHRLRQEMLLGVGGVRALRAHSRITGAPDPEVFHTNEGHAGFLGLERIRELSAADDGPHLDFDTALEVVPRGHGVHDAHPGAGGHRPVPSGADRAVLRSQQPAARSAARPDPGAGCRGLRERRRRRLQHGRDGPPPRAARQRCLAPPRQGQPRDVQRPLAGVRPGRGADHLDHQRRARPDLGGARGVRARRESRRRRRLLGDDPEVWEVVDRIPGADLWTTKRELRSRLVHDARKRVRRSWQKRGAAPAELGWIDSVLDPEVLTIGFARRVPSYKRLTLMMRDPERLKRLLLHPERPIQLVIAGKAHPADEGGKKMIQEIVRFADDPEVRHRIVFLPELRHRDGPAAVPRLRRLAEQPAAALRGVRHVGHEGGAERRAQPLHPGRLVGRVVRRRQRLGDPVGRRHRRPRPPRRHRGQRAVRPDRERGRLAVLRRRRLRACRCAGSRWCATR